MTMKRRDYSTVQVAQLKARLSEYLRAARQGETVLVVSHDLPVAVLAPPPRSATTLTIRRPAADAPPLSRVQLPPAPDPPLDLDIVDLLLQERGER